MGRYVIVGRDETPVKANELPYVDPYLFECGYFESVEDYAQCVANEVTVLLEPNEVE